MRPVGVWSQPWFAALSPAEMLLWSYLTEMHDSAGLITGNLGLFEKLSAATVDKDMFFAKVNDGKDRVVVLATGKWWLPGYIVEKYGKVLSEDNPMHRGIIKLLAAEFVDFKIAHKHGFKIVGHRPIEEGFNAQAAFEFIWGKYAIKTNKDRAQKHFLRSVKTEIEFTNCLKALDNYQRSQRHQESYILGGDKWFRSWSDWLAPTIEMMGAAKNSQVAKAKVGPELVWCRNCEQKKPKNHDCHPVATPESVRRILGEAGWIRPAPTSVPAYTCGACHQQHSPNFICDAITNARTQA